MSRKKNNNGRHVEFAKSDFISPLEYLRAIGRGKITRREVENTDWAKLGIQLAAKDKNDK